MYNKIFNGTKNSKLSKERNINYLNQKKHMRLQIIINPLFLLSQIQFITDNLEVNQ